MRHQQNNEAIDRANRLPSFFAVYNAIQADQCMRVFKNEDRGLKVDPMLRHIPPVLSLIPIEWHVVTIL